MTYAIRLEQLLDAVRVDPDEVVESAPVPSTNGMPDRIEEDIRVATVAGG